ncbi:hypothetical protein [Absidia glauca]|uniref:BHLH domain-containing protein n=1 Tax=Absidia glauca TaxID=4829 RepID=A0A168PYG3_ABSGL|nr:hypothetical protein [Absidia glauca]
MMPVDKTPSLHHSWRHSMIHPSPPSSSFHFGAVSYGPSDSIDTSLHDNGDRRTAHNAIERQRRECLNSKFEQLAHALPGLQNVRRPSKSMIVSKSLEFVTKSVHRDSSYQNKIRQLRKEHDTLRKHTERSQHHLRKRIISAEDDKDGDSQAVMMIKKKKPVKKIQQQQQHDDEAEITPALKRPKTRSTTTPSPTNKVHPQPKKPATVLHKFVHHHASSSNDTKPKASSQSPPSKPTVSPPPPQTVLKAPPYHFSFVPPPQSWPLLDLSAMQPPDAPTPSFYSPDMLTTFMPTTTTPMPFAFNQEPTMGKRSLS